MKKRSYTHAPKKQKITQTLCFYCLKVKSVGISLDDSVRKRILDMRPCSSCEGLMNDNIILISVKDGQTRVPTRDGIPDPIRSGSMAAIDKAAIDTILESLRVSEEAVAEIKRRGFAFIDDTAWAQLGFPRKGAKQR